MTAKRRNKYEYQAGILIFDNSCHAKPKPRNQARPGDNRNLPWLVGTKGWMIHKAPKQQQPAANEEQRRAAAFSSLPHNPSLDILLSNRQEYNDVW
jgi:hypothetical protein